MRNGEFEHPRLVEVYDVECTWGIDDDWFASAVGEAAQRVLDLGCGTGRLTTVLARRGHHVTGIDPARASLDAARAKPGGDLVTWIHGTVVDAPAAAFDVALMTSHVAQFIVEDDEWDELWAHFGRAVVSGGRVVFDTRPPEDRIWERWHAAPPETLDLPSGGTVTTSTEVTGVSPTPSDPGGAVVAFTHHNRFSDGEVLRSDAELRFRTEAFVRRTLDDAGFELAAIVGGWRGEPVGAGDGELIVTAQRR